MAVARHKMTVRNFIRKTQNGDISVCKMLAYSELVTRSFIDRFYLQNNTTHINVASHSLRMYLIPDVNSIISQYIGDCINNFEDALVDLCNTNYDHKEFHIEIKKSTATEITTIVIYGHADQSYVRLAILNGPTIIVDPYELSYDNTIANLTSLPIDDITNMSYGEIHNFFKRRIPPGCTDRTYESTSKCVYEIVQFINNYKFY